MSNHRWGAVARALLGGGLVLAAGLVGLAAAPAGAVVLPVDQDGCPAGGDPSTALPCVTFEVGCPKWGLAARLANAAAAGEDARFVITVDGSTEHPGAGTYVVAPNDTVYPDVHIGEDTTVQIRIEELETGRVFVDETFSRDCTAPAASVETECSSTVTLVNESDRQTVDFVIDVYDSGSDTPTRTFTADEVDEGGATVTVPDAGDGPRRIVVTASTFEGPGRPATTEVVADLTSVVDCDHPAPTATAAVDCVEGLAVDLVATDAEAGPTTFHVVVTGAGGDVLLDRSVTLDGPGATGVDLAELDDGVVSVVVTVDDQTILDDELLVDCAEVLPSSTVPPTTAGPTPTTRPTEVRGVQVGRQLPRTGSDGAAPQAVVAAGILLVGAGLVGFGTVPFMAARRLPRHARR